MIIKTVAFTSKLSFRLAVVAIALIVAVFIRLNISPVSLNLILPHIQPFLKISGYELKLKDLSLSFDGSLWLNGKRAIFLDQEGLPRLNADSISLAMSNHSLVKGQLVVKHAKLNGLNMDITRKIESLNIGGVIIPLAPLADTQQPSITHAPKKGFDLVAILNSPQSDFVKFLKNAEVENLDINFKDNVTKSEYKFDDINIKYHHGQEFGTQYFAKGLVTKTDINESTEFSLDFYQEQNKHQADFKLSINSANTKFLKPYLPKAITDLVKSSGKLAISGNIISDDKWGTSIKNPFIMATLGKTFIHPETAYEKPFEFTKISLSALYDTKENLLKIDALDITDKNNMQAAIGGEIGFNGTEEPVLNVSLKSEGTSLENLINYLPDRLIGHTTNWLKNSVKNAELKDINISFNGKGSDLNLCKPNCNFKASTNINGASLIMVEGMKPLTNVMGKFNMDGNQITIEASSANIDNNQVTNARAVIDDLWSNKESSKGITLTVDSQIKGETQTVITRLGDILGEDWFPNVAGEHSTQFNMVLPLYGDISYERMQYHAKSNLKKSNLFVEKLGREFFAESANLSVTERRLELNAKNAKLGTAPLDLTWEEDMKYPGEKSKIKVTSANAPWLEFADIISIPGLDISGTAKIEADIHKESENTYTFAGNIDSSMSEFKLQKPAWNKPLNQNLNINLQGQLSLDDGSLNLDVIEAKGQNVEILGGLYTHPQKPQDMFVQLNPFVLGKTNATISLEKGKLSIEGESLDLSSTDLFGDDTNKVEEPASKTDVKNNGYNRESIKFALNKIILPEGELVEPIGEIEYVDKHINKLSLNASPNGSGFLKINLPEPSVDRTFTANASNAGEALKALGIYDKMRGGDINMYLQFISPDSFEYAKGEIVINNTRVVKAPVLVKLLSLLSLDEIFSGKSGIQFDQIKIPLQKSGDTLVMTKANLKGPSMAIGYTGEMYMKDKSLDLKGSLIPAAGVNKLVNDIPLVGGILTGSQDGLLVADFSIKGTTENPDVFVNPLSIVTPGIVKDLFGLIIKPFKESKPAPSFPNSPSEIKDKAQN